MRVLHSVDEFLRPTQNWIYPQVFGVPGVKVRVFCNSLRRACPLPQRRADLIVETPPWDEAFGFPRLLNAIGRRLGLGGALCRTRIERWRPDVVHAHFGTRGWQSMGIKKRLNIPLITSFYGVDAWRLPLDPSWQARYEDLFEVGDVFLVEGPAMRNRLTELGCSSKKIQIQRIGVDLSSLPFRADRFLGRTMRIAMVGRFIEKKGLVHGLLACEAALRQGVDLTVTVIGDATESDPEEQRIKRDLLALAQRPDLSDRVHFRGFLPLEQMRSLLAEHDVFLCPSKRAANGDAEGGSPVVLTEAMAMGLLCIGTRHCDIPQVIVDGETGFLCDEGDVVQLADILAKAGSDRADSETMTRTGRRHVERYFSQATQLEKLPDIYANLQGGTLAAASKQARPLA